MKQTMKALPLISSLVLCAGCVISRPFATETITGTNGVITVKTLKLTTLAIWPATSTVEKQSALIGGVMRLGQTGADLQTGGTNVVEALKAIDSIISKIPK